MSTFAFALLETKTMVAQNGSIVLRGHPNRAVFVFLHGLGSSEADIYPLACTFNENGFTCEILRLPFNAHCVSKRCQLDFHDILATMHKIISKYDRKVFLVGFSTGAVLALLYAAEHKVDGVFALSTFLAPYRSKLAKIPIAAAGPFPSLPIPRRVQVTNKACLSG